MIICTVAVMNMSKHLHVYMRLLPTAIERIGSSPSVIEAHEG